MSDETRAMALAIAERKLNARGWRYSIEDIGRVAADIILAMEAKLDAAPPQLRTLHEQERRNRSRNNAIAHPDRSRYQPYTTGL